MASVSTNTTNRSSYPMFIGGVPIFTPNDLPPAVALARVLENNKAYLHSNTLSLPDTLKLPANCIYRGFNNQANQFTYTGVATLFETGAAPTTGFNVDDVTFNGSGASKALGLTTTLPNAFCVIRDCSFIGFNTGATFKDFASVQIFTSQFSNFVNGLEFDNIQISQIRDSAIISAFTGAASKATLRWLGRSTQFIILESMNLVPFPPSTAFFISPTIGINASVIISGMKNFASGAIFESGVTGAIASIAGNSGSPTPVTNVSGTVGQPAIFTAVGHNVIDDDFLADSGFSVSDYNGEFRANRIDNDTYTLVTVLGKPVLFSTAGTFGTFINHRVTITTAAPHTLTAETGISMKGFIRYQGGFAVKTPITGTTFDIQQPNNGTESGTYDTGSLDQTDPRVITSRNGNAIPSSMITGGWKVVNNLQGTSFLGLNQYTDFVFAPGVVTKFAINERITLMNPINGEIRYDGFETKNIVVPFEGFHTTGSGSAKRYKVKLQINQGAGYVDIPDSTETFFDVSNAGTNVSTNREVKVDRGDLLKWVPAQNTGALQVLFLNFGKVEVPNTLS